MSPHHGSKVLSWGEKIQIILSHTYVQGSVLVIMILRAYALLLGLLEVPGTGVVAESSLFWCMDMFVLMYFPAVVLTAAATDASRAKSVKAHSPPRSPEPVVRANGIGHMDRRCDNPGESDNHEHSSSPENPRRVPPVPVAAVRAAAPPSLGAAAPVPTIPLGNRRALSPRPATKENVGQDRSQSITHSQRSSESTPLCTPTSTPRPAESIDRLATPRSEMQTPMHPIPDGNVLGLVLSRWMKQSLVAAFGRWDQFTTERLKMKFIAGKVVKRWFQQSLWSSFDKWCTFAHSRKMLRRTGGAVVRRWQHAGLRKYFVPWAVVMQERWHVRCMEKKIRKWSQLHVMWAAFITWRDAEFSQEDGVLDNVFFKLATDLDNGLTGLRQFFDGSPQKRMQNSQAERGPGPLEEDANFVML
mmetsp:Transcript_62811/g.147823  ORF Transcript_62811/g.147823 Transcript_62811/m.147823 type:complete len:415 (-) Transcript_62811:590-1834(-)